MTIFKDAGGSKGRQLPFVLVGFFLLLFALQGSDLLHSRFEFFTFDMFDNRFNRCFFRRFVHHVDECGNFEGTHLLPPFPLFVGRLVPF